MAYTTGPKGLIKTPFAAALLALCLLVQTSPALGERMPGGGEFFVREYEVSVRFPVSCDVFSRNMTEDDPLLKLYGRTASQVRNELISQGLYLQAVDISGRYVMDLAIIPSGFDDFSNYDEASLISLAGQIEAPGGMGLSSNRVYTNPDAAYLLLGYSGTGGSALQCATSFQGALYRMSLRLSSGQISKSDENLLKKAIDSLSFQRAQ